VEDALSKDMAAVGEYLQLVLYYKNGVGSLPPQQQES